MPLLRTLVGQRACSIFSSLITLRPGQSSSLLLQSPLTFLRPLIRHHIPAGRPTAERMPARLLFPMPP